MRPSPPASLASWPTGILRPWLIASAAGFSLGILLLRLESAPPLNDKPLAETFSLPHAAAEEAEPPPAGPVVADLVGAEPEAMDVAALPAAAEGALPPALSEASADRALLGPQPPPAARQSTKTSNWAQNTRSSITSG